MQGGGGKPTSLPLSGKTERFYIKSIVGVVEKKKEEKKEKPVWEDREILYKKYCAICINELWKKK
jgi:hypothetical protein